MNNLALTLQITVEGVTKELWEIFEPANNAGWRSLSTDQEKVDYAIAHKMYPSSVHIIAETYSRDAERMANYELERLTLVNAKAKVEITWDWLSYDYAVNLLSFLAFTYNYHDPLDPTIIVPREAPSIQIQTHDLTGTRTFSCYIGQTIEGELKASGDNKLYWESLRIAFIER